MSTTLKIKHFVRYVRQGRTAAPVATTATAACALQAYEALVEAPWTRVTEKDAGLPRHHWAQSGFSPRWDAAKYCGDFNEDEMRQHAYACAADYVIKVPDDAITGDPCGLMSLSGRAFGDRWLADGAIVAAIPSASAIPPAWDDVLAATTATPAIMAVTPSNNGLDSQADVSLEFPASTPAPAYIHLIIRLANYESFRGAWIEGSAMLAGSSITVTFSRDVVADPDPAPAPALPTRTACFRSLQTADGALHFGGELGAAWYSSTVPSPLFRDSDLSRELSVKQALAQFPYAVKSVETDAPQLGCGGAGIKYIEAGSVDNVCVYSTVVTMFYHAQQPRNIFRFSIPLGMPGRFENGWHDGLHIRWAVYHIPGTWESDALSPTTLQDPVFWRGAASSIVFLTADVDRAVAATPVASIIMPDGGYSNNDTIPIQLTPLTTRGTFLLAWYPEDVTDHGIPASMDTFYGVDFAANIPYVMLLE